MFDDNGPHDTIHRTGAVKKTLGILLLFGCSAGLVQLVVADDPPRDEWITLGTLGGPNVNPAVAQVSNALVIGESVYLFDAGDGLRQQMSRANIATDRVRAVFLSHHHVDHVADLGPLLVTNWIFSHDNRVQVLGPAGTENLVFSLVQASQPIVTASFPVAGPAKPSLASTVSAEDLPTPLAEPVVVFEDENIRVFAIEVDHFQVPPSVPLEEIPIAVAYRIETPSRRIVYTGDTGESPNLEVLLEGADLLVSEVVDIDAIGALLADSMNGAPAAVFDSVVTNLRKNHLEPEYIGQIAKSAGVEHVVLTHFVPAPETSEQTNAYINGVRSTFGGEVSVARDLDVF